jgi:predicted DCC family thiol-disulfide oxidoreductase YuxK
MNVILFDGVCNLCNGAVNWVIDHDKNNQFKFAALQSAFGKRITEQFGLGNQYLNTIVLLQNGKVYLRATAVLIILKRLGGIYSLAAVLMLIPVPILNFFYNIVAKYRYQWFGKSNTCRVPSASLKDKFFE